MVVGRGKGAGVGGDLEDASRSLDGGPCSLEVVALCGRGLVDYEGGDIEVDFGGRD